MQKSVKKSKNIQYIKCIKLKQYIIYIKQLIYIYNSKNIEKSIKKQNNR